MIAAPRTRSIGDSGHNDSIGHRQVVFGVGRGIDRAGPVGGLVADEDGPSDERRKRAIVGISDENYTAVREARRS